MTSCGEILSSKMPIWRMQFCSSRMVCLPITWRIVDDHLMGVTHLIRAEEWISSAPLHMQIWRALDWEVPLIYHVPDILGKDRRKLSKRHGAASWKELQQQGFLPEAVINFLALNGWSYDDKTEFFTREELIKSFSLER